MPSVQLADELNRFVNALDPHERGCCLYLVVAALQGMAPDGRVTDDLRNSVAFQTLLKCRSGFQCGGPIWSGRLAFVTGDLLNVMAKESVDQSASAQPRGECWTSERCRLAERFGLCGNLGRLIDGLVGNALPLGGARYVFFRQTGSRPAHQIEPEATTLRVLLVLCSRTNSDRTVKLMLDGPDTSAELLATPGKTAIYYPGSTLVGTSRLERGELLNCALFDFQPNYSSSDFAPYVATPEPVICRMLDLADISGTDRLYDLGCGDGRIPRAAAARGATAVGIEADAELACNARAHLPPGVEIVQQDASACDLSPATVVTLFLNAETNERLRQKLETDLHAGTRVVSHLWPLKFWDPERIDYITVPGGDFLHRIYLYRKQ